MKMSKVLLQTLAGTSVLVPMTLALLASTRIASPWPWHGRWKQNSRLEITQITLHVDFWTLDMEFESLFVEMVVKQHPPDGRQHHCKCFPWLKKVCWSTTDLICANASVDLPGHEIRLKTNKDMASQIHREKEKDSSEIIIARNLLLTFFQETFHLEDPKTTFRFPGPAARPQGPLSDSKL